MILFSDVELRVLQDELDTWRGHQTPCPEPGLKTVVLILATLQAP